MYRILVGALQYVRISQPDIAFSVNKASQKMHAPTVNEWVALKWLLRYLKGTIFHGLHYSKQASSKILTFNDVD